MANKLTEKTLSRLSKKYKLSKSTNLISFINENPENFENIELYQIAQYFDSKRRGEKPYYIELETLELIKNRLPEIKKKDIYIVDPICSVGIFLPMLIEKYGNKDKISFEFFDKDPETIEVARALWKLESHKRNISMSFQKKEFLNKRVNKNIDLMIGNFPNARTAHRVIRKEHPGLVKGHKQIQSYSTIYVKKAFVWSEYIVSIVPKNFLFTDEYKPVRDVMSKTNIHNIIDMDTKGFFNLKNENIILFNDFKTKLDYSNRVSVYSMKFKRDHHVNQKLLTSKTYPNWIIYRNGFFSRIARSLKLNTFNISRNVIPNITDDPYNAYWVIRGDNFDENSKIVKIPETDIYVHDDEIVSNTNLSKTLHRPDLYVLKSTLEKMQVDQKPRDTAASEKLIILELKENERELTEEDIKMLNSSDFKNYFNIATNFSSRSKTVDSITSFYLGKLDDQEEKDLSETTSISLDETMTDEFDVSKIEFKDEDDDYDEEDNN
ncbi:DNA methyltransferase [Mycoplasma sp. Mirounga ES2805-ORL]|uniref:DNA methyltransferase n=1 Tax=Mycoplasma sp. Mirounga ES2805-ORL TaxID=754514 RepID=UPI00197B4BF7|nr:DNA methyltransferase [Mycoplasma sp. Mirounga ES2805-ORL]QSF13571.1 DNA methyltransferase [Mycoplasma sp. Mirounga ES2805-ORL]